MKYKISISNFRYKDKNFNTKEAFLSELSKMIDNCIHNEGTEFSVNIYADSSCLSVAEMIAPMRKGGDVIDSISLSSDAIQHIDLPEVQEERIAFDKRTIKNK